MEYAIDKSLEYMSERKVFGKTLDTFQVLRHRIARLSSEVEALKAFSYHCCIIYGQGIYDVKLCSMAKLICSELHERIATQCLQFYGGYGYMEDYPMARMYRDVRAGTIGAGTSEIMKEIISKMVIDDVEYKKEKGAESSTDNFFPNPISPFSEEHDLFRISMRTFLNKEVVPFIDEWEKKGEVPREIYKKFGQKGYFGLAFDQKYGGSNVDIWYTVIIHELPWQQQILQN
jgi:alkylation response protein AidB-like acyl-CoA dehydrogenase